MNRRVVLKSILALIGVNKVNAQTSKKKFYITGGGRGRDCASPPIEVMATDRLNALMAASFTVWTEEEWKDGPRKPEFQEQFRKGCEGERRR